MILATVSSLGALLYDWKILKAKNDDADSEPSKDRRAGTVGPQVRTDEKKE